MLKLVHDVILACVYIYGIRSFSFHVLIKFGRDFFSHEMYFVELDFDI